MSEREALIAWIRGDLVGPSLLLEAPEIATFDDELFEDHTALRRGPLGWQPVPGEEIQEVLYFQCETPHRKYGAGALHPASEPVTPEDVAANASDTVGIDPDSNDLTDDSPDKKADDAESKEDPDAFDDFELTTPDIRHPSTIGVSFSVHLRPDDALVLRLPDKKPFFWQQDHEWPLNGRYELCTRRWTDEAGKQKNAPVWRRRPALLPHTEIVIDGSDLATGHVLKREVDTPEGSPLRLAFEIFPRSVQSEPDTWLLTVVLRNTSQAGGARKEREATLYQTYFEIILRGGHLARYPEDSRPFDQLDAEEQSLALLYQEASTWGIGHGCALGWDAGPGETPSSLYADVLPAVETPSMTPDVRDSDGKPIQLSMRQLTELPDSGQGVAWQSLSDLVARYDAWIKEKRDKVDDLPDRLKPVAGRHLDAACSCLGRIKAGIDLLRNDSNVRTAFKLTNLAMLLQQIAAKQFKKRSLSWNQQTGRVEPHGDHLSPWRVFEEGSEKDSLGTWRAFQVAFLLMSLQGVSDDNSDDRQIVDLIWFPTGGGKTEAYLGVAAFYLFHQRLIMEEGDREPRRDGTNVLMRYTLRMLTTQQFQRAASLICAMEFLRRNPTLHGLGYLSGDGDRRFSLGLWIGSSGSPNNIAQASKDFKAFQHGKAVSNPLVLTECPWCRAEIGKCKGRQKYVGGISEIGQEGPLLLCPDGKCAFGKEHPADWLPVEVIDERIYKERPSLIIATADKFALVSYRPDAGALFGRNLVGDERQQTYSPPGLVIQDELHLISGPLGTIYGLYEGIFERLCSVQVGQDWIGPKIIASTATIRGAEDQIKALYARAQTRLFPSPGLSMSDSFFGTYARDENGRLEPGRLYLGIHANDYGSILTTQVRAFSSALFRSQAFAPDKRDPWWSLLVFYNSIRELGGARTLFDSDIRSRLKFVFNRENFTSEQRRHLRMVEELTSRLSQAEIVGMLDGLSTPYTEKANKARDVCLASSIIEVGVDIDRLSLMGVVGQPKTTAQYIQVTGRVGRRWWERPGLILTVYNPSRSRDRSHFEQFHSYHRRLYERVEPTSATPFALSAIKRALPGALIAWARQHGNRAPVHDYPAYADALDEGLGLLRERCQQIQTPEDEARSLQELENVKQELEEKWQQSPQDWEDYPPSPEGEYLMLWPGQFATIVQKRKGLIVPSSMRQVDGSAELTITQAYAMDATGPVT